jgi:O-antigen biosynthesis protein
MKKDAIVFYLDAKHGTTYHRVIMPAYAMKQSGINVFIVEKMTELLAIDFDRVAAVVFSRLVPVPNIKPFKKMLADRGVKLVVDIDDRWFVEVQDRSHATLYNGLTKYFIIDTLKHADIVWAASKYLAKKINKSLGVSKDKIHYVPNGINDTIEVWQPTEHPKGADVMFGYVAASHRFKDIELLKGLFVGKSIQLPFFRGADKEIVDGYVQYGEVFGDESHYVETVDNANYAIMYDSINCSIAPLPRTDFNMCKSSLKAIEAGFKKRALIASDVPLYSEIITHGKNGLLCKSRADWETAINEMTIEKSIDLGEALYETVKDSYSIFAINAIRLQTINI